MTNFLEAPGASVTILERMHIREMAIRAAETFGSKCMMVNIGVREGATLWCLRDGAPQAEILGVDVDASSWAGDWTFMHGDSRRCHALVKGAVHLLLVDGAHDYHNVRDDILNWGAKVPVGGLVVFHDYGNADAMPWTAGVRQAVDEFMAGREWAAVDTADSIKTFERVAA